VSDNECGSGTSTKRKLTRAVETRGKKGTQTLRRPAHNMHFAACFGKAVPGYGSDFFNVLMLNACSNVNTSKLRCTGSEKIPRHKYVLCVFLAYQGKSTGQIISFEFRLSR
jgi:hypothetical protein